MFYIMNAWTNNENNRAQEPDTFQQENKQALLDLQRSQSAGGFINEVHYV